MWNMLPRIWVSHRNNMFPSLAAAKIEAGVFPTSRAVPPSSVLLSALKGWSRHYKLGPNDTQLHLALNSLMALPKSPFTGQKEELKFYSVTILNCSGMTGYFILQINFTWKLVCEIKQASVEDFLGIYFRLYNTGGGKMIFRTVRNWFRIGFDPF